MAKKEALPVLGSGFSNAFGNRVAKADDPVVSGRPMPPLFPTNQQICGGPDGVGSRELKT